MRYESFLPEVNDSVNRTFALVDPASDWSRWCSRTTGSIPNVSSECSGSRTITHASGS